MATLLWRFPLILRKNGRQLQSYPERRVGDKFICYIARCLASTAGGSSVEAKAKFGWSILESSTLPNCDSKSGTAL
jgi:hypothetical protein